MPSTWLRMSRPGPPNFTTGLKTKLSANESQAARIRQQRKKRPSHSDDHGSAPRFHQKCGVLTSGRYAAPPKGWAVKPMRCETSSIKIVSIR